MGGGRRGIGILPMFDLLDGSGTNHRRDADAVIFEIVAIVAVAVPLMTLILILPGITDGGSGGSRAARVPIFGAAMSARARG